MADTLLSSWSAGIPSEVDSPELPPPLVGSFVLPSYARRLLFENGSIAHTEDGYVIMLDVD